tara:strand:+ start:408 stop:584 length:177 start_codon:yes stop_codon:yes gene_type:complete
MAKRVPKDIANEIYKAVTKLEVANELIKSWVEYYDIKELTESERLLLGRSKEFLGIKQ